jgi:hypothetical protein
MSRVKFSLSSIGSLITSSGLEIGNFIEIYKSETGVSKKIDFENVINFLLNNLFFEDVTSVADSLVLIDSNQSLITLPLTSDDNGKILKVNLDATPSFTLESFTLGALNDVFISTPSGNKGIFWDETLNKFTLQDARLDHVNGIKITEEITSIPSNDTLWDTSTHFLVNTYDTTHEQYHNLALTNSGVTVVDFESPYSESTDSFYFPSNGNSYLYFPEQSIPSITTNANFCMEIWFNFASELNNNSLLEVFSGLNSTHNQYRLRVTKDNSGRGITNLSWRQSNYLSGAWQTISLVTNFTTQTTLTSNTWYHVAITKTVTEMKMYLNGTLVATGSIPNNYTNYSGIYSFILGQSSTSNNSYKFVGYLNDFRVTWGDVRYTGNFTPLRELFYPGQTIDIPTNSYSVAINSAIDMDMTGGISENYVPSWSVTKGKYVPKAIGSGGSPVSFSLSQASDLNTAGASTGDVLVKAASGYELLPFSSFNSTGLFNSKNLESLGNVSDTISNNLFLKKVSNTWTGVEITTSDVAEGYREYYTDAKVFGIIGQITTLDLTGLITNTGTTGQVLSKDANNQLTFIDNTSGGIVLADIVVSDLTSLFETGTEGYIPALNSSGGFTFLNPSTFAGSGSGITSINGLTTSTVVLDTDDIGEGSTNKYYTDAKVTSLLNSATISTFTSLYTNAGTNGQIIVKNNSGSLTFQDFPLSTTDNLTEGTTNLYYSDSKVNTLLGSTSINAFSDVTLTSVTSNQCLVSSGTTFTNQGLTTSIITEGANLYYTNARVNAQVDTLSISDFSGLFTGTPVTNKIVSVHANGKLTFITAPSGGGGITDLSTFDTDNLAEGTTNLYYTNAKVATYVNTLAIANLGGVFTGTPVTGKIVSVNSSGKLTFTDAPSGLTNTDSLAEGSTNLYYTDARVTTRINATSIDALSDVSLTSPSSNQVLIYSGGAFVNQSLSTSVISEGTNLYYTNARVNTQVNTLAIANFGGLFTGTPTPGKIVSVEASGKLTFTDAPAGLANTDSLTEGSTNLYYTNARVTSRINTTSIDALSDVAITSPASNHVLIYSGGNFVNQTLSTSAVTEGTNLYYTNARVATHVNTLTTSDFSGIFTGTPTNRQIPYVDSNSKIAFGSPVPVQLFSSISANYTLTSADHGYIIRATGTITITIPNLFDGFQVTIINKGTGTITFAGSSGVTLEATALTNSVRYSAVFACQESSTIWSLLGNLG